MPIRGPLLYVAMALWSGLKVASLYFFWWWNKRRRQQKADIPQTPDLTN